MYHTQSLLAHGPFGFTKSYWESLALDLMPFASQCSRHHKSSLGRQLLLCLLLGPSHTCFPLRVFYSLCSPLLCVCFLGLKNCWQVWTWKYEQHLSLPFNHGAQPSLGLSSHCHCHLSWRSPLPLPPSLYAPSSLSLPHFALISNSYCNISKCVLLC